MRTKVYGPALLFIAPDGLTGAIEYPSDTPPTELVPALRAALEAGFEHGDPVLHLPEQGVDVTMLRKSFSE